MAKIIFKNKETYHLGSPQVRHGNAGKFLFGKIKDLHYKMMGSVQL